MRGMNGMGEVAGSIYGECFNVEFAGCGYDAGCDLASTNSQFGVQFC